MNNKKSSFLNKIGLLITILVVIILFNLVIHIGADKTEIVRCEALKSQSETLEKFWITQWQKDMCDNHGYTFAGTKQAPVNSLTTNEFEFGVWYVSEDVGQWQLDYSEELNK